MILLYVTFPSEENTKEIISLLLEKKLIACANLFPIKSMYNWKGKKEENNEIVALLKTKESNYKIVKAEIEKGHSYEIPCILKISVEANLLFNSWIEKETQ